MSIEEHFIALETQLVEEGCEVTRSIPCCPLCPFPLHEHLYSLNSVKFLMACSPHHRRRRLLEI